MVDFFDTVGKSLDFAANAAQTTADALTNAATNSTQTTDFTQSGFSVPPMPSSDGNGLPSSKIRDFRVAELRRDIIHWFVPEFGVVRMYVNPNNINYSFKKLINKERTKGGYVVQYWGEDLTTLTLSGTTGSSGVEGINVLNEVYRAEQYAFDSIGLALDANNSINGIANQITSGIADQVGSLAGSALGDLGAAVGVGVVQGLLGADNFTQLAPRNIPSLASLAFGVEMFYAGWVYRGWFEDMSVTERADNLGLFDYTIHFTTTQRRGYRLNGFGWQRSATSGPSNLDGAGGTPLSIQRLTNSIGK